VAAITTVSLLRMGCCIAVVLLVSLTPGVDFIACRCVDVARYGVR
jgi:hypothetical protein